jgi:hypothetical protein
LVKEKMPFSLESIQVDGGSEFRKDYEDACRESDRCKPGKRSFGE